MHVRWRCAIGAHVFGFEPPYGEQLVQSPLLDIALGTQLGSQGLVVGGLELVFQVWE